METQELVQGADGGEYTWSIDRTARRLTVEGRMSINEIAEALKEAFDHYPGYRMLGHVRVVVEEVKP